MKKLTLLALTLFTLSRLSAEGLDDDLGGFESDLSGFEDDNTELYQEETQSSNVAESPFTLTGNIAFKTSYGYRDHTINSVDYSGFNQAQTALYLQLDTKFSKDWKLRVSADAFYDAIYKLHPNTEYNSDVLDTYETQLRFDDVYIQGKLSDNLDLKVGRQIVVWGKSDSIRITDIINPLDNRLPGLTDIEDLRLSVGMLKLDYYIDKWNISAMAIPENRVMLEAAPRGEFFPVDDIFQNAPNPFIELVTPENSLKNTQYALSANGVFSGWDLSFYMADVLDQKWHINPQTHKREVSKVKMLGSAINIAYGSWLLKSEVAYLDGIKYNSTQNSKSRLDTLLGVDYMGIKDVVLSLEVASRHIFEYETQMSQLVPSPDYVDKNELQTAIRLSRSYANDTLNVTALASMFGASWEYGGFVRTWMEYDIDDGLTTNIGFVEYIDGDKPFQSAIKDNDRIFADITYSF